MLAFSDNRKATESKSKAASAGRGNLAQYQQSRDENWILHLQRTLGNQAVLRMLQTQSERNNAGPAATTGPPFVYDFSRKPAHGNAPDGNSPAGIHRSIINRDERASGKTNRRFDTFAITEKDLSDPDIIARLNALSKVGLIEYRKQVKDLAVIEYLTDRINRMPALPPCTAEESKATEDQVEAARKSSLPMVAAAVRALGTTADNSLLCAFSSNFNTPGDAPEFQSRRLIVGRRLTALASKMNTPVPYECVPADDPTCMRPGKADTVAYVLNHQPPIKFCPAFRSFSDDMTGIQQAIVVHEYAHLVGGIDDSGGYALNGAQLGTCGVNTKFKAQGDVLINTADALAGFVMHIGLGLTPPTPAPAPTAGATTAPAATADSPPSREG